MRDLRPIIAEVVPEISELRHEIHQHPELGYQEFETAKRVEAALSQVEGIEIQRTGVAETGIVALLAGEKSGPCVGLRAEMDCLRVEETSGKPYASKRPGLMHACGHDGHTACAVGAAKVLSRVRDDLPGPVKFIFQPAEEGGGGAERLCAEGVLENPKVDALFGLHGWPWMNLGEIATVEGPVMAGSHGFEITVEGKGGHAARPQAAIDPLVVASHIVLALQTIVSRNVSPKKSAVLTIGSIQCGETHNVIADRAHLMGTLRCYSSEVAELGCRRIVEIVEHTARAFGAEAHCDFFTKYPAVVNDAKATEHVRCIADQVLDSVSIRDGIFPVMYGEDFAFYGEHVPTCFWALGVKPPEVEDHAKLHQPKYDFPDNAIPIAIEMHCEIARRWASSQSD